MVKRWLPRWLQVATSVYKWLQGGSRWYDSKRMRWSDGLRARSVHYFPSGSRYGSIDGLIMHLLATRVYAFTSIAKHVYKLAQRKHFSLDNQNVSSHLIGPFVRRTHVDGKHAHGSRRRLASTNQIRDEVTRDQ